MERGKMDEADFKNAVAVVKTGAEAGVPFGEIEGHVCAALPVITHKEIEAAFERAAGEFRAEVDALFAVADELRLRLTSFPVTQWLNTATTGQL
jgi:hypothetical protein